MRQRASLDIIADDRGPPGQRDDQDGDPDTANQAQDDSRSASSSSSPAPPDNEESDFFLGANDSQSSLGVPNLQDMQVTDDECIVPINRLPNEILIAVFSKLNSSSDLLHVMLACKRWARNAVDILWHRPACSTWEKHASICQTLGVDQPYFSYRDFIKRLNLASLADKVNDGSVMPLAVCTRVERLTLTGCKGLTDTGLIALIQNNTHLHALDISLDEQITEASMIAVAETCRRLQGLNVSGCTKISSEAMIKLAQNCRYIKRLKLNDCSQLNDEAILAFAENCPNILEIDLHQCRLIGNEPVTALMAGGQSLREFRLANCELIDDSAFLSLPPNKTYEHLRILDLTSCARLTDRAVERIIDVAPRLRNLVLAKCRNITDAAVYAIARLGKNLHYVHLGHCSNITDDAVKRLVQCCGRIRYIDLGCCTHLTDESVTRLATLPKLKRIGLVKCSSITDDSVYALAKANQRSRQRRDADGNIDHHYSSTSSLERVHLSYCTNLTLKSILRLLNSCPRLTHLSLTGVQAFLREDLEAFCRDAPPEFTEHQRSVFCVFSGQGVVNLRRYLNNERAFADLQGPVPQMGGSANVPAGAVHVHNADSTFDDGEPDAVDDDDGLEDGSEMVIDTQPLLNHQAVGLGVSTAGTGAGQIPPPPPPPPPHAQPANGFAFGYVGGHPPYVPQQVSFPNDPMTFSQLLTGSHGDSDEEEGADVMDVSPAGPSNGGGASTATGQASSQSQQRPSSSRNRSSYASVLAGTGAQSAPGPTLTTGVASSTSRPRSAGPYSGTTSQSQSPAGSSPGGA
ncbi:SCF E3 ubiquitin ligase complex F-box protein grrA [Diplogelasinospora grovesii]|uniref:SCF E3 ubiquitin ligase complex F-box protein grrA n=1 Tax=Diplogelasinospora grovesii TaxID=303347 RepID=A0AAN6N1Z2_9PEZI|nr:SCF E3 ubiquitin ligase complex F-box protein grrA [Diplogelasinospora grovesii]